MYEIIFQTQFITLKSLHIAIAISFIASFYFLIKFSEVKKLNLNFVSQNLIYLVLTPIVGGRLFYVIENFSALKNEPLILLTGIDLGLSSFGILYAFMAILFYLTHQQKEDFWAWLDAFVISGLLGLTIIHLGHFLNGSHYGTVTSLPWGIAFDTLTIPFIKPIHPTQLYSAAAAFLTFQYLIKKVRRTHLTGLAGNLGFMIYCILSFGIDFLHGDPSSYVRLNLLIIASAGFVFYTHCSHRKLLS